MKQTHQSIFSSIPIILLLLISCSITPTVVSFSFSSPTSQHRRYYHPLVVHHQTLNHPRPLFGINALSYSNQKVDDSDDDMNGNIGQSLDEAVMKAVNSSPSEQTMEEVTRLAEEYWLQNSKIQEGRTLLQDISSSGNADNNEESSGEEIKNKKEEIVSSSTTFTSPFPSVESLETHRVEGSSQVIFVPTKKSSSSSSNNRPAFDSFSDFSSFPGDINNNEANQMFFHAKSATNSKTEEKKDEDEVKESMMEADIKEVGDESKTEETIVEQKQQDENGNENEEKKKEMLLKEINAKITSTDRFDSFSSWATGPYSSDNSW